MTPRLEALAWALLHLLWQAELVLLVARATLGTLGPVASRARHRVALGALLTIAILPALTTLWLLSAWSRADAFDPAAALAISDVATRTTAAHGPASLADLLGTLQPILPGLLVAWLAGTALTLIRLGGGWLKVRRLTRTATAAAPRAWVCVLARLRIAMGVRPKVRIALSTATPVPVVAGVLRPVILVPARVARELDEPGIRAVLAHELAHVKRRDPLLGFLQALVECPLFFLPALRRLGRLIREAREHCCDDLVVQATGRPRVYARALATLEELRAGQGRFALAATDGPLAQRIERLVLPPAVHPGPARRLAALGLAMALSGALATALHLTAAPYETGVAMPHRLRPFAGPINIQASDPAGPFTVAMRRGRVTGATLAGTPVPAARLVQTRDSLRFLADDGTPLFAVRVRPSGGISWRARGAGAAPTPKP